MTTTIETCPVHKQVKVSVLKVLLQDTFRFPVTKEKEVHPDPTTELSPSQHLKSKIILRYMRDAGFQEQIIVNEKEDRSGSNQTLEEHLQISGTC